MAEQIIELARSARQILKSFCGIVIFEESRTDSRDASLRFDQIGEMRCPSLNRGLEIDVVGFALANDCRLINAVESDVVQKLPIECVKIGRLVFYLIEGEPRALILAGFL
jgi:hypothetical protein